NGVLQLPCHMLDSDSLISRKFCECTGAAADLLPDFFFFFLDLSRAIGGDGLLLPDLLRLFDNLFCRHVQNFFLLIDRKFGDSGSSMYGDLFLTCRLLQFSSAFFVDSIELIDSPAGDTGKDGNFLAGLYWNFFPLG